MGGMELLDYPKIINSSQTHATLTFTTLVCGKQVEILLKDKIKKNQKHPFFVKFDELRKGKITTFPMKSLVLEPYRRLASRCDPAVLTRLVMQLTKPSQKTELID